MQLVQIDRTYNIYFTIDDDKLFVQIYLSGQYQGACISSRYHTGKNALRQMWEDVKTVFTNNYEETAGYSAVLSFINYQINNLSHE